jgi:hypothetical protein
MRMSFNVGAHEGHHVQFVFNKFWGFVTISVDGVNVVKRIQMFSTSLVRTYEFTVGVHERHTVRIDKHHKFPFGGARPQPVFAYVDGQLVAQAIA